MGRPPLAIVPLAVAAALLGGCGGSSSPPERPSSGPLISFEREGGLAYSRIRVAVDRGGEARIVTSATPGGTRRRKVSLDDGDLARLRRLIADVPLSKLPRSAPSGCVDCYAYRIAYGGAHYATDEANVPHALRPVIAAVEAVAGSAPTAR